MAAEAEATREAKAKVTEQSSNKRHLYGVSFNRFEHELSTISCSDLIFPGVKLQRIGGGGVFNSPVFVMTFPPVHLCYCTLGVGGNPSSFFCTQN